MSEADPELPDVEFYTLPDLSDTEYWERFIAAGLHQPTPEPTPNGDRPHGTWDWLDLTDPQYAIPPDPPAIAGLLYAGKRHVASGPQESAKTLICYHLILEALRADNGVAIVDFEMGPVATRRMLTDLGATDQELAHIHYTEPHGPPADPEIDRLVKMGIGYVLIDASAGAFDTSGLDDNSRKDAETFARTWIQPLFREGIATIVLDHVTKNAETRGKYAIGSERKTGGADVHLGFEALKTLTRGGTGTVKITAHKDRGAYLPRPTAAIVKLKSDSTTHQVAITIEPPEPMHEGLVKHTILAEKISRALEALEGEPISKNGLEELKLGGRDHVREAASELVKAGYLHESDGPRGAILYTLVRPFVKEDHDLAGTSPEPRRGEVTLTPESTSPYIAGGNTGGEVEAGGDDIAKTNDLAEPAETPFDVYDPTIQHLLDDTPDW